MKKSIKELVLSLRRDHLQQLEKDLIIVAIAAEAGDCRPVIRELSLRFVGTRRKVYTWLIDHHDKVGEVADILMEYKHTLMRGTSRCQ